MATTETFGRHGAERGQRCTNDNRDDHWTTPCCYEDIYDNETTECPRCGAPISCTVEQIPSSVCTIRDPEDEDD